MLIVRIEKIRSCYAAAFVCLCLILLSIDSNCSAGMEKKVVESVGTGSTLSIAIYDSLNEAIGRVNGRSIEALKQFESITVSETNMQQEDYYSSQSFQSSVKTATKGIVDGYDILSKSKNADGFYEVTLSVRIVRYISPDSNRKRIAIWPVKAGEGNFTVYGKPLSKKRVSRILTQNIASTLVQTRRFTILDRDYMDETLGEKDIALSPNSPIEEMARLGQELVADYILVAFLEDIGTYEKTHRMIISGREISSTQGNIELSVRIIDAATRQIVFSDFVKLNITEKDLNRNGSSLHDQGPEAAIAVVAADYVGSRIIDVIYPNMIVSVSGETVTIGQGGSQLQNGERLQIFKLGKRLMDPYTNEFIGREEIPVGLIEITMVNPKQSHARIVESSVNIASEFEPKTFICRAPQDNKMEKMKQKKEERVKSQKDRDEKSKKRDKDW